MARIADLTINLNADDRKLKRDLNRARGQWKRYSRQVGRDMQKLGSLVKRGAGIATAALAGLGVATVKWADQLGNTSRKIGITTTGLQRLRFAFSQNGVAAQTTDMALQRFTRRVAEAAMGTGAAKDALQQLGIRLKDAQGNIRPTERLMQEVAEAMRRIEDPAERVRLAFQLFDSEGVALVTTLAQGSAAMQEAANRLQRLGGVVSEEAIANAQQLSEEFGLLSNVLRSQFANGMLSSIRATTNWDKAIRAAGEAANRGLGAIIPRILSVVIEFRHRDPHRDRGAGGVAGRARRRGRARRHPQRRQGDPRPLNRYMRLMNLMLAKSILKWVGLGCRR